MEWQKIRYPYSMSNQINSIALLGTSADPPTFGHQALLKGLANLFPKVITWASDNPEKEHEIPLIQRHKLLKIIVNNIEDPKIRIVQELSSPWTITTLELASKIWPQSNLNFVIGSDLIQHMPQWLNSKSIFEKAKIAIAPREGWPINSNQLQEIKKLGAKIEILPLKIPCSSSSSFREQPNKSSIPSEILPILLKENLYGINSN